MSNDLVFLAGKDALSKIRAEGLAPEQIKVIAGAAGGPKWLVLNHLDRFIFSSWLPENRTEPLFLLGSSIGSWRFAAVMQKDPLSAIERFQTAYLNQSYTAKPTAEEVAQEMIHRMNDFLDDAGIQEIFDHPYLRLNIMAVRSKELTNSDKKLPLSLGILASLLMNVIHRGFLKYFFERALFYDFRQIPPFFEMDGFPIQKISLYQNNLRQALLASGSIPIVMTGVSNIPGAAQGIYRDGGVIDYHQNIPFMNKNENDIVLFPHYTDRIIPGWLDKKLFWRKPHPAYMRQVLLVAPSKEFIKNLPYHKIPDRTDFRAFLGRDKERMAYWNTVIDASERLAEEFSDAVLTGKIKEQVRPLLHS